MIKVLDFNINGYYKDNKFPDRKNSFCCLHVVACFKLKLNDNTKVKDSYS